ncbi:YdcF family protein [Limnobaculum xujianqingii]|uniref:YdcF family protein n=1 Tax=Limnobaculum xujianqingii TaxID=2738837 RepID=UPI00112CE711|nr:YdcF family protein [Limnobaculum xujianqingii]
MPGKLLKYSLSFLLPFFIIGNVLIAHYKGIEPEAGADSMIILGAQVIGNPAKPSRTLRERLDVAIPYLKENPNTRVIVCGGQGRKETATESSVMKSYLINNGIESQRIYEEDQSTRTIHQFIYSRSLTELGKTVIVTSDFHMLRSFMLARRSGIEDISGLPAAVGRESRETRRAFFREPLALLNSFLFDHPEQQPDKITQ